jgi:hypothetical protein
LKKYLQRHPEISEKLSHNATRKFFATNVNDALKKQSKIIMNDDVMIDKVIV